MVSPSSGPLWLDAVTLISAVLSFNNINKIIYLAAFFTKIYYEYSSEISGIENCLRNYQKSTLMSLNSKVKVLENQNHNYILKINFRK